MARPTKQGIDYFPLDCQFNNNFQLYKIDTGANGLAIWLTVLQMIYSNEGYYIENTKDIHLLIKREIDVELAVISDCLKKCIDRGIFNKSLHESNEILTSPGIQRRYFDAAKRKKLVKVNRDYLLINVNSYENLVCSHENPVLTNENSIKEKEEEEVKEEVEKQSSPNEKTDESISPTATLAIPYKEIQTIWNDFAKQNNLARCNKLSQKLMSKIQQRWTHDLQTINAWGNYLEFISQSEFLSGRTSAGNGRTEPFRADLDWITNEDNFANIANGRYHDGPI